MKLKLLFMPFVGILFLLTTISNVSAQRTITPFTKRIIDSTGQKVYIQAQKHKQSPISVTFGYGYSPITSHNKYSDMVFPYHYSRAAGIVETNTGAISFGINTELTPWLELNVSFLYSENTGVQPILDNEGVTTRNDPFSDFWASFLPTLRINWVRNNWLSVYSRAGVGMGLANRKTQFMPGESVVTVKLAFVTQFSPVGIEMGTGQFNIFVEGGYGYAGMVTAGVKLKVGGKSGQGRNVDWYDKYMN